MELIPIIYTVLVIVVVLTVITLTFSYISFRVKQKKHDSERIAKTESVKFEPVQKIRPVPVHSPHKQTSGKESHTPAKKVKVHEKPSRKTSSKEKSSSKSKGHVTRSDRISVMKNLSTSATKEEPVKKPYAKPDKNNSKSLGDDILDKYVEEEDKNLFTLKVKDKKKKPE
ncbi:MAG: hypothetical protein WC061_09615 [Melioribacteraceae bacterium]